jgi:hypothetical protein
MKLLSEWRLAAVTFTLIMIPSGAALGQGAATAAKPREVNITSDSAAGWLPSEELESKARKAATDFFSAIESEDYRRAYDMMTKSNQSNVPFERFEEQGKKFHGLAGPLKRRDVLKVTWTKDPANAPNAGVYVAIDVAAVFAGVDRECGYVVLYQRPAGGAFEVARTESNYIDNGAAKSIAEEQSVAELNRLWRELSSHCPNYSPPLALAQTSPPDEAPLPESSETNIEYKSVADALQALRARPGVLLTTENGWLIATDEAAYTIWSFAPSSYPAYPAVVKRQVIAKGSGSSMVMSVHCEASKSACDDLVRTFSRLNGFDLPK